MKMTRWILMGPAAATVAVSLWGCSDDRPAAEASRAEAKVTGTVKIHGKPMASGEITFNPANYQRDAEPRKAPIKNGSYEITTLVGQNSVLVSGPEITREPELGYAAQSIDVSASGSTLNIELPPPQQPAPTTTTEPAAKPSAEPTAKPSAEPTAKPKSEQP